MWVEERGIGKVQERERELELERENTLCMCKQYDNRKMFILIAYSVIASKSSDLKTHMNTEQTFIHCPTTLSLTTTRTRLVEWLQWLRHMTC